MLQTGLYPVLWPRPVRHALTCMPFIRLLLMTRPEMNLVGLHKAPQMPFHPYPLPFQKSTKMDCLTGKSCNLAEISASTALNVKTLCKNTILRGWPKFRPEPYIICVPGVAI